MVGIQLASILSASLTALVLIAGLIVAAVTIRRNGRASGLAMAGCGVLLVGELVFTIGYRVISYSEGSIVTLSILAAVLHVAGIVLLLSGALLPRKAAAQPAGQPGGWSAQPEQPWNTPQPEQGGWGQQAPTQTGHAQQGYAQQGEQGWNPQGQAGWTPGYGQDVPQQPGPYGQPGVAPQSGPPFQPGGQPSGPPHQQPYPPQQ
ncbi:hypothetical protein [Longispora fulva]|uniref:Uncharacterized protein n=1 Tax=Longispora fulva TaxID=619741 RepID=A0A8J7GWV4_9ACTN|nr:hypothetical protein [Longispora fulva]MBG6140810.1 hypothetical protein [Longispora fulva]